MNHKYLIALICVFNCTIFTIQAQKKKTVQEPRDTSKTVQLTAPAPPKTGPKPYNEVINNKAITKKGLFNVHKVDEKWFFEINDSLLNRDILIVNRISKAPINTRSGFLGFAGDEINQNVIRFEKGPNHKFFLRNISYSVYARDTAGDMYKSVMNSNIQPISAAFEIKAYSADSVASVIDVTDILSGDTEIFFFAPSAKTALKLGGLQNDKSYINDIRSYPMNIEIRTVKTYNRNTGQPPAAGMRPAPSAGGGLSTFELNSSLILLPANPMRPRYYDHRVPYFTTEFIDFDADPQGVKDISLITRWRMEPKPEDLEKYERGELVEPAKPIVFYIDPATPKKWIPYLIQGVNDWQSSFEKAGFKNAIFAKPAPTPEEDSTWSLEDARYNAIVYKPSDIPNASGPHIHDPRTGEILESHINWYHNIMQLVYNWYIIQAGAIDTTARKPTFSDELMGELIRFVSSHEVGHTLGLPHNMGSSHATPVEKLRDKKWVEANGHTASIMDYARFNYVAQPEDKVSRNGIFPRIGDYDHWAIEYGYRLFPDKSEKEEKEILNNWIKSKANNPRLKFIHMNGMDPRAQTEDLSDNAMKAGAYGIKNLKRILPQLNQWTKTEGEDFKKLDKIYSETVTQYSRYMNHAAMNIGGIYSDAKTTDQSGPVFRVVPKTLQKEAVRFLNDQLFVTPYWLIDKNILDLVAAPTSDRVSGIQDNVLSNILSVTRLQRMISSANRDKNAYRIDELILDLKKGIWSELSSKKPIDNYRRNLQKSFVERMITLSGGSGAGSTPTGGAITISLGPVMDTKKSDIVSVAKATLRSLKNEIDAALPGFRDNMSRYHLMDIKERIDQVFKKN